MGVKINATGELKLIDSPHDDDGGVVQDGAISQLTGRQRHAAWFYSIL